ncbi:MAG: putative addiction module antidote protein [Robiginitomaculum sp.]|nr:putative addiction module antidote protein [Robiginitomaculum sp.]
MTKQILRNLDAVEEDYFRKHPEEMDDYIQEIFAGYAQDRNAPALLASLRVIAKVKGMSNIAQEIGLTRRGLYKALSTQGNPRFDNINALMQSFGYQLMPQKIDGPV